MYGISFHTCIHTYIHTRIHTYTHAYIHTYTHTYIHTYTHTYKHTYIHAYIHTCIHKYIHISNEVQAPSAQTCPRVRHITHRMYISCSIFHIHFIFRFPSTRHVSPGAAAQTCAICHESCLLCVMSHVSYMS